MKKCKHKRTHNLRRIKQDDAYTVKEVTGLLSVTRTTLFDWLKKGLKAIDSLKPILLHGSDLYTFLHKRQSNRKAKLSDNQFYCMRCKKATFAKPDTQEIHSTQSNKTILHAKCSLCNGAINRFIKRQK